MHYRNDRVGQTPVLPVPAIPAIGLAGTPAGTYFQTGIHHRQR